MPKSNNQTARDFLNENQGNGPKAAMDRFCSDDFVWWVAGSGEVQENIDSISKLMRSVRTDEGTDFVVRGVTCDGDRVAIEAEATTSLINGTVYNNQYHMLFEFRDGQICAPREYHNTAHARQIWTPIFKDAQDKTGSDSI
jgi:ketosteroid isomerase-like protein